MLKLALAKKGNIWADRRPYCPSVLAGSSQQHRRLEGRERKVSWGCLLCRRSEFLGALWQNITNFEKNRHSHTFKKILKSLVTLHLAARG